MTDWAGKVLKAVCSAETLADIHEIMAESDDLAALKAIEAMEKRLVVRLIADYRFATIQVSLVSTASALKRRRLLCALGKMRST
jgi:hypothetical protein